MIHRAKKRILAAALTLALILTQTALYAQADTVGSEGNPSDGGGYASSIINPDERKPGGGAPAATPTNLGFSSITAFEPLPEDVAEQEVTTGTPLADLDLPDALAATVEDGDGDQIDADVPVTRWSATTEYDPQEMGAYTFTPELAAGYTVADGVELPEITVRVFMGIMPLATEIASGTCGANVTWSLDSDGVLTISGAGDMADYANMASVPWYNYRSDVAAINIGNGVTSIGDYAFDGCTNLASVTIPDSVTSMGRYAFADCTSLESVTIPDSVTSIGDGAFEGCTSLESVTIGNSVTSIGIVAFFECTSLASVTIPDSVTSMGSYAFADCTSLESVTIGNSVAYIDDTVFGGCTSITSVTFKGTTPPGIPPSTFVSLPATGILYCPEGAESDYTDLLNARFPSGWTLAADTLHTITIQPSANGTVSADKTQARAYETVTLTVSPDTGYYVADWKPTPSSLLITENYNGTYTFTMPGENVTLSPEFREYLSVTYDANGGTGGIVVGKIVSGTDLAAFSEYTANVSRVGHFFLEWNTAADGTGDSYDPGDLIPINDNLTLYAVWQYDGATTVNLTYNANGGSGGPDTETGIIPGHTRTAPAPDAIGITPSGSAIFTGWNTLPGGAGDSYDPGDTVKVDDDMTLYAIWEPIFTITTSADANGSIAPSGSILVSNGGSQTFTITPDHGYEIADVLVDSISVGAVPTRTFSNVTANHSIHATFRGNINAQTPNITVHPAPANYTQKDTAAALTVTASVTDGGTLSYQWYSNTTDSTTGGTAVGTDSDSYTPSTAATGNPTATVTSNTAAVTVNALTNAQVPSVDVQPVGGTYTLNASAILTVGASVSDGGALSYQWYRNANDNNSGGNVISGATVASYAPPTDTVGTTYYYVVVTNTNPYVTGNPTATVTSNTAAVTVNALTNAQVPSVDVQPVGGTYTLNAPATLNVTASVTDGGTLSYQWYSNTVGNTTGGTAVGGNSSSYTPSTDTIGTTYYYVVVTNTNSSVNGRKTATATSNTAAVVVNAGGGNPDPRPTLMLGGIDTDTVTIGTYYNITVSTTYTGNKTLAYSISSGSLPDGMTLNAATGSISGTPKTATEGDYPFTITVEEQSGTLRDSRRFTLTVQSAPVVPDPVVLHMAKPLDDSIRAGYQYSKTFSVAYTGSETLVYEAQGLPANLSINAATGEITGVPAAVGGPYTITVTVREAGGGNPLSASTTYELTVTARDSGSGNTGGPSGGFSSGRTSGSGRTGTADRRMDKTQLPASAFSWDGGRTLTINHDSVTVLGLLSVQWNGQTLIPDADFTAHQGSVIIRFSEDFIAAQATGDHTVFVEFLNHYGETAVKLNTTDTTDAAPNSTGGDTHNPQTGGFNRSPWWWLVALIPAAALTLFAAPQLWRRLRRTEG